MRRSEREGFKLAFAEKLAAAASSPVPPRNRPGIRSPLALVLIVAFFL